jgi:hypothetical protein
MTDWATYPLQVMDRGHVLNDEEVRMMCAEIASLRAALVEARDTALEDAAKGAYARLYPQNPRDDWTDFAGLRAEAAVEVSAAIRDMKGKP